MEQPASLPNQRAWATPCRASDSLGAALNHCFGINHQQTWDLCRAPQRRAQCYQLAAPAANCVQPAATCAQPTSEQCPYPVMQPASEHRASSPLTSAVHYALCSHAHHGRMYPLLTTVESASSTVCVSRLLHAALCSLDTRSSTRGPRIPPRPAPRPAGRRPRPRRHKSSQAVRGGAGCGV